MKQMDRQVEDVDTEQHSIINPTRIQIAKEIYGSAVCPSPGGGVDASIRGDKSQKAAANTTQAAVTPSTGPGLPDAALASSGMLSVAQIETIRSQPDRPGMSPEERDKHSAALELPAKPADQETDKSSLLPSHSTGADWTPAEITIICAAVADSYVSPPWELTISTETYHHFFGVETLEAPQQFRNFTTLLGLLLKTVDFPMLVAKRENVEVDLGSIQIITNRRYLGNQPLWLKIPTDLNEMFSKSVAFGELAWLKHLVNCGLPIDPIDQEGWQPLHVACKESTSVVVDFLIESRADVSATTNEGQQPLHVATDLAIVKSLLGRGMKLSKRYLKKMVGAADSDGRLPMHFACRAGETDIVKCLVAHGAKVDTPDLQGHSPLHIAVLSAQFYTVRALVILGADPLSKNLDGKTPLDLIRHCCNPKPLLMLESEHGHGDATQMRVIADFLREQEPSAAAGTDGHRAIYNHTDEMHQIAVSLALKAKYALTGWLTDCTSWLGGLDGFILGVCCCGALLQSFHLHCGCTDLILLSVECSQQQLYSFALIALCVLLAACNLPFNPAVVAAVLSIYSEIYCTGPHARTRSMLDNLKALQSFKSCLLISGLSLSEPS